MSRHLQNICSRTKKKTRVEILKFESKKKFESSWKKKYSSRERENADQLCCQSMSSLHRYEASIQSCGLLATKYCRFFFSLGRLIEDLVWQLSSASYDSSELLFRRHDKYKRTLATLSSRYCETYGCLDIGKFTRVYCSDSLDRLMSILCASVLL